jgi:hypothetical protein
MVVALKREKKDSMISAISEDFLSKKSFTLKEKLLMF